MMALLESLTGDFHFLRPLWLLALIPAGLLILVITFLQGQSSQWARNIDPALLPFLLDRQHSPRQNLPLIGLLLIWILSATALAGPVWQQLPMPVQQDEDALIVVMDLSLSMYADDLTPNRITRSRRKLVDVLNSRSSEGQTALVVYAGDAHAVTPITDDVETINNLVPALDPNIMPVPGSQPEAGVTLALELLENATIEGARILLMTDGINREDIGQISDLVNTSSHTLSILGIGTDAGAPIPMSEGGFLRDQNNAIVIPRLERNLLEELATVTAGGRYSDVQLNDDDIDYLLAQSLFEENENLQETEREYDTWQETGPWLVLLMLPLAALAFRQGWVLCLPLLFLLPAQKSYAIDWEELWQNRDQRGISEFENERFDTAAETFENPRWRAASNYRRGRWEDAVNDLEQFDDAQAHYNRGNALAQLFRLEESIAAYDAALEQDPGNQDALRNRELVKNLLEEQERQQQEQQDQQQQQENEQNQEQGENEQEQQEGSDQNSDQQSEPQEQESDQNQEQEQSEQNESDSEQEQQEQEQQMQQRQPNAEEEQSMQQWLGRIQDDPAELLRNKFRQQSQLMMMEQIQNPGLAQERAQEQIW